MATQEQTTSSRVVMSPVNDSAFLGWIRHPGLRERLENSPELNEMEEWCYQLMYGCYLTVAIAQLEQMFLREHPRLDQQRVTLARVPRGGLLATEILEQLLEDVQPEVLSLDRESIRLVRRTAKALQTSKGEVDKDAAMAAHHQAMAQLIPEVVSAKEGLPHLVLPEDIADSGNTLLLIVEAYMRRLLEQGQATALISILVPTASEQSLSPTEGIIARAEKLAAQLSEEYHLDPQMGCQIIVKLFTLHEENDSEYLAALRQDRHDHGTTHEAVRQHPQFAEMKQVLLAHLSQLPEVTGMYAQQLLQELLSVVGVGRMEYSQ